MPYMFSEYKHNSNYRKAVIIFEFLIFYRVDERKSEVKIYRVLHDKREADVFWNIPGDFWYFSERAYLHDE